MTTALDPLRPKTLTEFRGQDHVADELRIVIGAAQMQGQVPPHMLFSGPAGLGKTTLAAIVATESGMPLITTSAPLLANPGDLVSLLVGLDVPTVVFIDEIHQLAKSVEETLYSAMEDTRIDLVIPDGTIKARVVSMPLEPFTLVGATTSSGSLGAPFRDRFGYTGRLTPYPVGTLSQIVTGNADKLGTNIDDDAAVMLASRSRGTPRIANRLLRRVNDWRIVHTGERIDIPSVNAALDTFGVDFNGLGRVDRELLGALCENFDGGPVGLSTLAAAVGESEATLASEHEPYLMRAGFLARTPRGRVATLAAYEHLGLPVPAALAG
jgi:Holliday junction DNA helicase RuvB